MSWISDYPMGSLILTNKLFVGGGGRGGLKFNLLTASQNFVLKGKVQEDFFCY